MPVSNDEKVKPPGRLFCQQSKSFKKGFHVFFRRESADIEEYSAVFRNAEIRSSSKFVERLSENRDVHTEFAQDHVLYAPIA